MYQFATQQQKEEATTKLPSNNDDEENDNNSIDVNDAAAVVVKEENDDNGQDKINNSATSSLSEGEVALNDNNKKPLSRRRSSAKDAFVKQNSVRSLASTDSMTSFRTATSRCRSVMDDDDDDMNSSGLRAPIRRLSAEHTVAPSSSTAAGDSSSSTANVATSNNNNNESSCNKEGVEGGTKDGNGVARTTSANPSVGIKKASTASDDDENDDSGGNAPSDPSRRLSSRSDDEAAAAAASTSNRNNEDYDHGGSSNSVNVDSVNIADSSTVITEIVTNVKTKAVPDNDDDNSIDDSNNFTARNITAANSAIMSSSHEDDGAGLVDIEVNGSKKDNINNIIDKEENSNSALNNNNNNNNTASSSSSKSANNGSNSNALFQPFLSAFSSSLQQIQASSTMSNIRSSLPSPSKKGNRAVDNDNFEDSPPPPPRTKTKEELGKLQELQQERQRIEQELAKLQILEEEEKRRLKIKEQQEEALLRQNADGNGQQQICPKERDPNQRPPNSSRSQKYTAKQLKQPKKQQQQQQQEISPPSKSMEGNSSSDMLLSSMFNQIQQGAMSIWPLKNFDSGDALLRNSCTSIDSVNGLAAIIETDEEDDDNSVFSAFSRKNSMKALMQLKSFVGSSSSLMSKQPLKEGQEEVFPSPKSQEETFPSATATLVSEGIMDYKFPLKPSSDSFHNNSPHTKATSVFATVLPAFFHVDEEENPSPYGTPEPPKRKRSFTRSFYLVRKRSKEFGKKFGGYWFWIQIFVAFLFLGAIFALIASLVLVSNKVKSHDDKLQTIASISPDGINSGAGNNNGDNTFLNGNNNDQNHNNHNNGHSSSSSSTTMSLPVIEGTWKDVAEPLNANPGYGQMDLEYMYGHALSDDGTILALTGRTVSLSEGSTSAIKINGVFIRIFQQRDGFWHPLGSDISSKDILQNDNEIMLNEDDGYFSCWSLDMNSDGTIVAFGTTTVLNSTSTTDTPKTSSISSQKRQQQSVTSDDDDTVGILQKVHVYNFDGKEWNTLGNTIVIDSTSLKDAHTNLERKKQSIAISDDGKTLVVGTTVHFLRNDKRNPTLRQRRHGKALNGNVRVYKHDRSINGWSQFGQTLTGFESGDQFGWDVDISANGAVIAVGATQQSFLEEEEDDESSTKEEEEKEDEFSESVYSNFIEATSNYDKKKKKSNTGYACVFELDNSKKNKWKIRGKDMFGIEHNDRFGWSISLSKDGNTLAVGAPNSTPRQMKDHSDEILQHPGQVYVFYYTKKQRSSHYERGRKRQRVLQQQHQSNDIYEWVQDGIVLSGAHSYDNFGSWVDLSARGDVLIVAAHLYKNEDSPYYHQMNGYTQIYTSIPNNNNHHYNGNNDWYRVGNTLMSMKYNDDDVSNNNNNTTSTTTLKNACGIINSISADGTVIVTGNYPFGTTELKIFKGK